MSPRPRLSGTRSARQAGFSLLEVVLVLAILAVSGLIYAQTLATSRRLDPIASEMLVASEAARVALENLRARPIEELVAAYDDDPSNDPGGPGTAPGATFAVAGLVPVGGAPVGRVELPLKDGRLAEDCVDALLGMPRDLDGDGAIDALDHRDDWALLPVRVRLEWRPEGTTDGRRELELYTLVPRL
jgi:prepilin-type N-terminal cleavage/methylation domain-containing protein